LPNKKQAPDGMLYVKLQCTCIRTVFSPMKIAIYFREILNTMENCRGRNCFH
jgi:hypothetical protein